MSPFRSTRIRAFVALGMLAGVGCASSQDQANYTRSGAILRRPAQSVSHPPQTFIKPPVVSNPVLLQANNSTLNPIKVD
jgi:hypothetical protein